MAELYFPFASVSGDRKVGPEIYERMLGDMFTAGVFPRGEMLAVAPASGMQITLKTGGAVLIRTDATSAGPRGYLYSNTAAQTLTCNVADGVAGRIDAVVLRWSRTARSVTAAIVTGTPAATPTAPTPTRTADTWEMCLAQISVAAGATEITAAQITDTRETELCGIASSIAQLDSADFYAQQTQLLNNWLADADDDAKAQLAQQASDFNTWFEATKTSATEYFAEQETTFENWFAGIKNTLGTDVAGSLGMAVEALQTDVGTLKTNVSALQTTATGLRTDVDAKQPKRITSTNVSVATSAWVADSTYSDYPKAATVSISGVTATMVPEVVFAPGDATSGNYAPVAVCVAGGVKVFAAEAPEAAITLLTIVVWG
jgi:hypothetical protein